MRERTRYDKYLDSRKPAHACGSRAITHTGYNVMTGRPEFKCDHCADTWTRGPNGGEWSVYINTALKANREWMNG